MTKSKSFILWVIVGVIALCLLWRNRAKVAPTVFNDPPASYLDSAYPQIQITAPSLQVPASGASCGCNPQVNQYLSNAGNAIAKTESQIEEQLKSYTDSINAYFATQFIQ